MAAMVGAEEASQSQEPVTRSGAFPWVPRAQICGQSYVALAGSWIGSGTAWTQTGVDMECCHGRGSLILCATKLAPIFLLVNLVDYIDFQILS